MRNLHPQILAAQKKADDANENLRKRIKWIQDHCDHSIVEETPSSTTLFYEIHYPASRRCYSCGIQFEGDLSFKDTPLKDSDDRIIELKREG